MNKKVQLLRAVSIMSVILIHTCVEGIVGVVIRPLINFCVAMFIFLSGYLTQLEVDNVKSFYKKRILKVLIPYLVWSVIYTIVNKDYSNLILNIFTTSACYTLYYIAVYIQLVLITPFLKRLINSKYKWLGWCVQPLFILVRYTLSIIDKSLTAPWSSIFFAAWFSYYYLGILLGNKIIKFNSKKINIVILYIISLCLQILEGIIWYCIGDVSIATSQIKLSALFTSIVCVLIGYLYIKNDKNFIKENKIYDFVMLIANCSFGIYLAHPLLLSLANKFYIYKYIPYPLNAVLILIITLIGVLIVRWIVGDKYAKYLGV